MRKLIITAHPNPNGFTHHIAERFAYISKQVGHDIRILNLYDPSLRQDFLLLDIHNQPKKQKHIKYMQAHISWAEEIVFVYPIWRYDCPAILKNWFDVNLSKGFAYEFRKNSILPCQPLRGKTARFFVTTGSPTRLRYTPVGWGIWISMIIGRLGFVGICTKSFTIFGSLGRYRSPEDREKMLQKVEKIAKK